LPEGSSQARGTCRRETVTTDELTTVAEALAGNYEVTRALGAGGMATVYLARDHKHNRDVAIKVLRADLAQTLGAERFLREIQLAAKLAHPHILPLFDSGEAGGALYFVMPRVEGRSVRDRLDEVKVLPVSEAVGIAVEVAGALDYAHRHGIVHRDIKPENIMLQDGHALVADFGIGKAASDVASDTLTQAGMSVGTPAYMSPEQAVGEDVDGRSDIYSLGCVLYEMLVGEPPFTGPNVQAVIAKRFVQTPADVTALREGISRAVARTVRTALARTPIDRYHSAADMIAALREVDALDEPEKTKAHAPAQSIAVLPFTNLSADRDNEYFGDGIAEDIINALSQVSGLHVAARMSAFSFKGRDVDLHTVGEQLNVSTVLQGSVRKAGTRIRITAQLMTVNDGYQLWSERYDRELVDVFAVQDEIAGAIADRLQLTFAPSTTGHRATTSEVEAYELVTRGRALTAQRGRPILAAITCFERAIELAPNSAAALAGLGNALRVKAQYGLGSATECLPLARASLERALEIEPDNAEATGHLAAVLLNAGVTDELIHELWERALVLDPRLSEVRALYGAWGLAILREGREDARADAELRRASADDPRNPIIWAIVAMASAVMGRFEEGVAAAKHGCDIAPGAFAPRYALAWTQTWARHTDDGIATVEGAIEQFGRHHFLLHTLTGLYMQRGDHRRAAAVHAELEARAITSRIPHYSLAMSAMYLGRMDEAIDHAIRSAEVHDAVGPIWVRWPDLEPLRAHPRYADVLSRTRATVKSR
jgi:serine/threonine-protein kinase